MKKTLLIFRIFFLLISLFGCVLIPHQVPEWRLWLVMFVGMGMGSWVILVDLCCCGCGHCVASVVPSACGKLFSRCIDWMLPWLRVTD